MSSIAHYRAPALGLVDTLLVSIAPAWITGLRLKAAAHFFGHLWPIPSWRRFLPESARHAHENVWFTERTRFDREAVDLRVPLRFRGQISGEGAFDRGC